MIKIVYRILSTVTLKSIKFEMIGYVKNLTIRDLTDKYSS